MKNQCKTISVLIPCHNEAQTIQQVICDFKHYLPEAHLCICDNASSDDTWGVIKKPGICRIHESKKGKGRAIKKMLDTEIADIYVFCDGDNTYNVSKIQEMVDLVTLGPYDMVIGNRMNDYEAQEVRPFGAGANHLVRWLLNTFFHIQIQDPLSGLRVCTSSFLETMPEISDGFEIEIEMDIHSQNYMITEIPIGYSERTLDHPSNLKTVRDGGAILLDMLKLYLKTR